MANSPQKNVSAHTKHVQTYPNLAEGRKLALAGTSWSLNPISQLCSNQSSCYIKEAQAEAAEPMGVATAWCCADTTAECTANGTTLLEAGCSLCKAARAAASS